MSSDVLHWPLMQDNVTRVDLDRVIAYLQQPDPRLTQGPHVRAFEEEWSQWLGVRRSVFVNSGSSANQITLGALRELHGGGEVVVPSITWVSDIAAVLQNGFEPVFVDIDPRTLGMDNAAVIQRLTPRTRAVFLTHVLGFNALRRPLLEELNRRGVWLLEDGCEAHGATFEGRRVGSIGWAANFSFYYAHHLSTIEGGMVATNNEELYETLRMFRSHGMVREQESAERRRHHAAEFPELNPDFIFMFPAYNVRATELAALIGRSQLPRLDENIARRNANFHLFLENLDPAAYWTDFALEGMSNYAFVLVLRGPDELLRDEVFAMLRQVGVEFRRGTAGGGNQLRQPYLRRLLGNDAWKQTPLADHVHFFGCYIGNYPGLERDKILRLCDLLNQCAKNRKATGASGALKLDQRRADTGGIGKSGRA